MTTPTQHEVRQLFTYDSLTGIFTHNLESVNKKYGGRADNLSSNGYMYVCIGRAKYRAHRMAYLYMTGELPSLIDHKDRDKTNNAWSNLRASDKAKNALNTGLSSRNKSGVKGVSYHKGRAKWYAKIRYLGTNITLGSFIYKQDAVDARLAAEQNYYGSNV